MSRWTHVIGAIHVDTWEEVTSISDHIKKKVKNAPKIMGSEKNASVFVNAEEGYNISSLDNKHSQSRAIITIQGDLRDKDGEKTKKEVEDFIKYIQKLGWKITILCMKIEDEYVGEIELKMKEEK